MRRNKHNEMPFVVKKTVSGIKPFLIMFLIAMLLGWIPIGFANVAVLDFELKDMTLSPPQNQTSRSSDSPINIKEINRTATLAPLLKDALAQSYNLMITPVPPHLYLEAQKGIGYLFERPQAAAKLGNKLNAEWIIVSRLHKPSHLFAYLISRVVHVPTAEPMSEIIIEIKGQQDRISQRGINKLAQRIQSQMNLTR
ncbi:DUF2380 domain-containing protein [Enterovibrio norvegicus]|uniref:DUF2380 domain-containing protein n=2 Tax=Enterovibrio norvegicus TaxID=188144 RepID=A0A2N7LD68_9GAMM|nr:DUF2380 domain-containing protein [Enterovibrio norvegicus]